MNKTLALEENVCRTCMEQEDKNERDLEKPPTFSIFNTPETMGNSYITIMELLMLTTPQLCIEKDDMLPKVLCGNCVDKLIQTYEFQQMCIRVEHKLRDIISNELNHGINQNSTNNDPLKVGAVTQNINDDLNSILKIEMDEPLIDQDEVMDDNDFNFNPTSSDNDDSEWELQLNTSASKKDKNVKNIFKEEHKDYPTRQKLLKANTIENVTKETEINQFKCDECGNRLKTRKSLRRHKLIHLRPENKKHEPEIKKDESEIKKDEPEIKKDEPEIKKVEPDLLDEKNPAEVNNLANVETFCQNNDDKASYQFSCDACGGRLKTLKSLKRHKLIHLRPHVKKDDMDNLDGKPSETENQSNVDCVVYNNNDKSSYQFKCDVCGNRLKTRKSLKKHKRIHLRPPGIQKEKIPKNATETLYECEHCKKAFQRSSALKDHIRLHTGEKPYLCSECGKSFRKSTNLKQHLLRHSSEKPYVCADCPKCFLTLSDLASHRAVHTKTKSHVCDVCGAGFGKPYLLKAHKMYHTGEKNHKCEYCDRRFVTGDQCKRHMRTHTGEKPYKCKYCERAFAQSNDLMKHMKSHLGDNVYKCSLCPQGFRLHCDLREHFNSHKHDDEETKLRNLQALKEEELRLQIKFGLIDSTF